VNLSEGYQIEDPQVLVPWGITEGQLLKLLPVKPREVTDGYYWLNCVSLSGLGHVLGFHFAPRQDGRLSEFEVFRRSYGDMVASYDEFQHHLVATFGEPTQQTPGDEGLPNCTWQLGTAQTQHSVFNRFRPEEHVRLVRR